MLSISLVKFFVFRYTTVSIRLVLVIICYFSRDFCFPFLVERCSEHFLSVCFFRMLLFVWWLGFCKCVLHCKIEVTCQTHNVVVLHVSLMIEVRPSCCSPDWPPLHNLEFENLTSTISMDLKIVVLTLRPVFAIRWQNQIHIRLLSSQISRACWWPLAELIYIISKYVLFKSMLAFTRSISLKECQHEDDTCNYPATF